MAFVTEQDIIELNKNGIDYIKFEPTFLKELKVFLLTVWSEEYHADLYNLESKTILDFNKLIDYPSTGGYMILDNTFTAVNKDTMNILSNDSKGLIGYFYGIHLR